MSAYPDTVAVIRELAPHEPAYLFCENELRRRTREFLKDFPGLTTYAVKANPTREVLETLADAGVRTFDVASIGEIEWVRGLLPDATLHFNNPVKPLEAIREAYTRHGIRSFAADDEAEIEKLRAVISNRHEVEVSVRFKLRRGGGTYDLGPKFGAQQTHAATLLRDVARSGFKPSLAFHPGSQCTEPREYARHVHAAGDIARAAGIVPHRLNVGGGFPSYYDDSPVPGIRAFGGAIDEAASAAFGSDMPPIVSEPGRGLVAESVSLLTRVYHRRSDGTVFINDGVYGGLLEQIYGKITDQSADMQLPVRVWRGAKLLSGETRPTVIFGPTCDSVDRLPTPLRLPGDLRPGDYVEFGVLGAYASATATEFNGFRSRHYVRVARGFHAERWSPATAA